MTRRVSRFHRIDKAIAYCARPAHLRRTTRIALVVGLLLTAVNQGSVLLAGNANTLTWVRCAANFLIPFVVSNLGLLGGRSTSSEQDSTGTVAR